MNELQYDNPETGELEIIATADSICELESEFPHLVGERGYEVCDENFRCQF